jgi:hypothetical protein
MMSHRFAVHRPARFVAVLGLALAALLGAFQGASAHPGQEFWQPYDWSWRTYSDGHGCNIQVATGDFWTRPVVKARHATGSRDCWFELKMTYLTSAGLRDTEWCIHRAEGSPGTPNCHFQNPDETILGAGQWPGTGFVAVHMTVVTTIGYNHYVSYWHFSPWTPH